MNNHKHHTPQLKAIIRVCASCGRVFINSRWGCPSCGFASYGAVWTYGYNSLYTFYRLCLDTIRRKGVRSWKTDHSVLRYIDSFVTEKAQRFVEIMTGKEDKYREWHRRYKARLMEVAKLSEAQAQECLDAGMGEYDYDEEPEEMADSEMSYWTDDDPGIN